MAYNKAEKSDSPMRRKGVYLAIAIEFSPWEYLTSGSLVKRPISITLFIQNFLAPGKAGARDQKEVAHEQV